MGQSSSAHRSHTLATFSQLPSGKWRVQVRRHGLYRSNTFDTQREAKDWSMGMESKAIHVSSYGFRPFAWNL